MHIYTYTIIYKHILAQYNNFWFSETNLIPQHVDPNPSHIVWGETLGLLRRELQMGLESAVLIRLDP